MHVGAVPIPTPFTTPINTPGPYAAGAEVGTRILHHLFYYFHCYPSFRDDVEYRFYTVQQFLNDRLVGGRQVFCSGRVDIDIPLLNSAR